MTPEPPFWRFWPFRHSLLMLIPPSTAEVGWSFAACFNGQELGARAVGSAEITTLKQRGRPFEPGQSGNPAGLPKGARNKLSTLLVETLVQDFAEHGEAVIARLRCEDPAAYLKAVCALVPKEVLLDYERTPDVDLGEMSDDQFSALLTAERTRAVRKLFLERASS